MLKNTRTVIRKTLKLWTFSALAGASARLYMQLPREWMSGESWTWTEYLVFKAHQARLERDAAIVKAGFDELDRTHHTCMVCGVLAPAGKLTCGRLLCIEAMDKREEGRCPVCGDATKNAVSYTCGDPQCVKILFPNVDHAHVASGSPFPGEGQPDGFEVEREDGFDA